MNPTELKAEAYDCINQIELLQARLREINQQIASSGQPATPTPAAPTE